MGKNIETEFSWWNFSLNSTEERVAGNCFQPHVRWTIFLHTVQGSFKWILISVHFFENSKEKGKGKKDSFTAPPFVR